MKKRYKNHIKSLIKKSPIVGFSKDDLFFKHETITADELAEFNVHEGLEEITYDKVRLRDYEKYMYSNLVQFTDNYFLCGGHNYVYLLKPIANDCYKVIEKESIGEWVNRYWSKEDPDNKRDWCYFDEDTHDLYKYIMNCFDKNLKHKINTYK